MARNQAVVVAMLTALAPVAASADPLSLDSRPGRDVTAGVFLGGDLMSRQNELGNSYFSDQVPGSAFLIGGRGGLVLVPDLMPGSSLAPRLAIEVEAKLAFSTTDAAEMRDSFFAPVLGWRAHLRGDAWPQRRLSPFLVAGVGGETVISGSPFLASGDTDAAAYWGAGARWRMSGDGRRPALRVDLRHVISAGRDHLTSSSVEIHVGLVVTLGTIGGRPRLGKKVLVDGPPPEPPPAPPVADRDHDGIPDDRDRCPDQPESADGVDDDDGCPEVDDDGDGLAGSRDKCPGDPEDADGFQDDDGCPDLDDDGDGIPDLIDQCPREAETANGFQDEDGCPDEVPPEVQKITGVQATVQFATNSAALTGDARAALNRMAAVLKKYPGVRIRVAAHTDNRGTAEENFFLSRRRADAVKAYLVGRGITADRIETTGFGADQPIADNATPEGRKQNRRVEISVLGK